MIEIKRRQHDDTSRGIDGANTTMAPTPSRPGIRKSIKVTSGR